MCRNAQRSGTGHASPPFSVDVPLPVIRILPVTWPEGSAPAALMGFIPSQVSSDGRMADRFRDPPAPPAFRLTATSMISSRGGRLEKRVSPTIKTGRSTEGNAPGLLGRLSVRKPYRAELLAPHRPILPWASIPSLRGSQIVLRDRFQPRAAPELRRVDPKCRSTWHEKRSVRDIPVIACSSATAQDPSTR
jgi:hypothetical protein